MAMNLDEDILQGIAEEIDGLSESELRNELQQIQTAEVKRKARQEEYNATPEAQARRKEYYERTADQRKEYRRKYNARKKLILQKAAEAGITADVD